MIAFHPVPAFQDNYIWVLSQDGKAVVVDPGDAGPVQAWLDQQQLNLIGILITHYHPDHVMGLPQLTATHDVPVWGPTAEAGGIPSLSESLQAGDSVSIPELDLELDVIELPGHTLGHIGFIGPDFVLCGDTLFASGCGRLFEGTPEQMQTSLAALRDLPASTRVYCAHEYTLDNMDFALAVEPDNDALLRARQQAAEQREQGQPTLPTTIGAERRINPFLRWDSAAVIAAARDRDAASDAPAEVFGAIRRWKDSF